MKINRLIVAAVCLVFLKPLGVGAHPYASGVTNSGGVISWVLNESATDVKIIFDGGTATNDLGSAPVVGKNTFSLGTHTSYQIVVFNVGSNAITQISDDLNLYNNFYGPRGVAVNRNPKTWNFGRIYVANAAVGQASDTRTSTRGIYCMDAASEDILNQGNTAATAGITFGNNTTYSPYKVYVGPDDCVYAGDAASATIGGVWRLDPNLAGSSNIFGLANPSSVNSNTKGTNFGRVMGTPNASGSLQSNNLVLTFTSWDLNLINSSGGFGSSAIGYQNVYQYNIGGGPLPWKSFPTVITNPISIGNVNGVGMDAEIAPDGKIFITSLRNSSSDGTTNVVVLNSTGTTVLWDSKTQSASYFGDSVNDHLSAVNYSIAISPDDKFVVIQGALNNNFMLMALTNGVPDISTLTTNLGVGANGGVTCRAASFDAADNVYVTSGGSDTLRIFSLGYTTTCVTSNDATCTNGSFKSTLSSAALAAINTPPTSQTVQCSSNATFSVGASGASINYQWYQGSTRLSGQTNSTLNLGTVSTGQSGSSYKVVVSNSLNSVTSSAVVLTVVDTIPPVVTLNGSSVMSILQGGTFTDPGATAFDTCAGALSVTQHGTVNVSVPGTYQLSYVATDLSANSATNFRTVYVQGTNGAPSILNQPSNIVAQCLSSATFSVIVSGASPLTYRWYRGATLLSDGGGISGSGTANLTLSGNLASLAGNYKVVVSNSLNTATSQTVSLTVNDTTSPSVTVLGSADMSISQGSSFTDPGATASDACVGSLSVTTTGSVNVNTPGTYLLTYSTTNSGGISAGAQRAVIVNATNGPISAGTPNLIPLPVTVQNRAGTFTLCPTQPNPPAPGQALMQIQVDAASQQTGQYLAALLYKSTGYQFQVVTTTATNAVRNAILITTSNAITSLGSEGYELTVAPDSVLIRAPAQAGGFYGVQTFLQLLPPQIYSAQIVPNVPWIAPCIYVQDQPRFAWRGAMLDVARHFIDKVQVEQILDSLAAHKINTMHWHLTDDNGWRIEITNYPALTSVGAWRFGTDYGINPLSSPDYNSAGYYGGYYTQAQIREVVAYAQQRHITIVPEIEMPCHAQSALLAYPQYGCGNAVGVYDMDYNSINYGVDLFSPGTTGTYAFLEEILTEVMNLFPSHYIHCGGDEVVQSFDTQWNSYGPDTANMTNLGIPINGTTSIIAYQHDFSTNIAAFLQANGRMMMGWDEFEAGGILTNAALMNWMAGSTNVLGAATNGRPVVMSPNSQLYINYVETTTNIEPYFIVGGTPSYSSLSNVYTFEPIPATLPAQYDSNILGAQCNLWTEYVPSYRNFMYKLYPRMCALAELTWSPSTNTSTRTFSNFTTRLVVHEQRLAAMGMNYNQHAIPQIGSWGSAAPVPTTPTTNSWDITPYVTAAGEFDVNFFRTNGVNGLAISSVALLQNGQQVDIDAHDGLAQAGTSVYTLYIVNLPETKPGATYTIQAVYSGAGGTNTSGIIYLPNWN